MLEDHGGKTNFLSNNRFHLLRRVHFDETPHYILPSESRNKNSQPKNVRLNNLESKSSKPSLPFVKVIIGDQEISGLVDSGASGTILALDRFKQLKNHDKYVISNKKVKITVANNKTLFTAGKAKIPIAMKDMAGHTHSIEWEVHLSSSLSQDLYLGFDLFEGSTNLRLSKNFIELTVGKNQKLVKIPVCRSPKSKATFSSISNVDILPFQTAVVPIYTNDTTEDIIIVEELSESPFEVTPCMFQKNEFDVYNLAIYNPTPDPLQIWADCTVAEAKPSKDIENLFSLSEIILDSKPSCVMSPCNQESLFKPPKVTRKCNKNINQVDNPQVQLDLQSLSMNKKERKQVQGQINQAILGMEKNERDEMRGALSYINEQSYLSKSQKVTLKLCALHLQNVRNTDNTEASNLEADKRIDQMSFLSDQEKQDLKADFRKDGYFQLPHTELEEKFKHLTSIDLDFKDIPKSDSQLLSEISLDHLEPKIRDLATSIFKKNIQVFCRHEWDIPSSNVLTADIVTKPDAFKAVRNEKYVPIPISIRARVDELIEKMCRAGIVRRRIIPTPTISNFFVVKKKDGSWRAILDARLVNDGSESIPCHQPSHMEIATHIHGKSFVTSCDLANSFYSIPLTDRSSRLFSFFNSKREQFSFQRVVQGHKQSPAFLQALLHIVLAPHQSAIAYADDVVHATKGSPEDHLKELGNILQSFIKSRLKIKARKLQVMFQNVEVCGFVYNRQCVKLPSAKVQAIREWPRPKSIKQIKSFIMTCSYYRRHIPNFSSIAFPLQEATRGDRRSVTWTKSLEDSFTNLKSAVSNALSLVAPDPNKRFFIASDASKFCSSFVVWQLANDNSIQHIGCISRTFTESERNSYGIFKLEVLAVIQGLAAFDYCLRFAPHISLFIDARSIIFLRGCKNSNSMLKRFAIEMSTFNLYTHHVAGTDHVLPDNVSRSRTPKIHFKPSTMTEEEAHRLCEMMSIPDGYSIDIPTMKKWLTDDGFPAIIKKKQKSNQLKTLTNSPIKPTTKKERKINLPKTSTRHPFYPTQAEDLLKEQENTYENENEHNKDDEDQEKDKDEMNQCEKDEETKEKNERFEKREEDSTKLVEQNNNIVMKRTNEIDPAPFILNGQIVSDGKITMPTFRKAQEDDSYIQTILSKNPLPKHFIKRDNVLLRVESGVEKLVLPESLIESVVVSSHFSILGHHKPAEKIITEISQTYYHKALAETIKRICSSCFLCRNAKSLYGKQIAYGRKVYADQPRVAFMADYADGLPEVHGYKYILIFVCEFSNFVVAVPTKTRETGELMDLFQNHILSKFGIISSLYSDNEGSLTSNTFVDYLDDLGIEHNTCPSHSPWANGNVERVVGLIKQSIRIFIKQTHYNWCELLPFITLGLNTRLLEGNFTPEQLMFGQVLNSQQLLKTDTPVDTVEDYIRIYTNSFQKIQEARNVRRKELMERKREHANKTRKESDFQVQDIVAWRSFGLAEGRGTCLRNKFSGVYEIIEINNKTVKIKDLHSDLIRTTHLQHIKKLKDHQYITPMNIENDSTKILRNKNSHTYNLRSKRTIK